jgi:hypothetical protein
MPVRARAALFLTLLCGLAAAVMTAPVRAQEPATLEVTADRTTVTVGDRITVTLVLRLPEGVQPDFSALDRQFGDLDVLLIGLPEERPLPGGRREVRVRYQVAAFRPGGTEIPPLTVPLKDAGGTAGTLTSAPIPVTVQSVLPPDQDPGDIRDLKPQVDLPYRAGLSRRAIAGMTIGAVAVALALLLAWRWWRARASAPRPQPAPVPAPDGPEVVARAELDRISGLGLLDAGDLRQFHALIAACIRRYLTERFAFSAIAMTTAELARSMETYGVGRWPARLVAGLLSECDAVLYAGYRPARERAETNLAMAYEIVTLTAPPPAPPPEAEAAALGPGARGR